MISKEKFAKFRLNSIIDAVEQITSYEYDGEIWNAEVYGFTECLFTRDSLESTKIVSLDLEDLKGNVIDSIFLQLELNPEEILKDSSIRKIQEGDENEIVRHLLLDSEGYYIFLKYDHKKIVYCSIFSFIPEDVQNKFKSKPDEHLTESALTALLEERSSYHGILPYSIFEKLQLKYFLDYGFIENYPGENELFYGFGEKSKSMGITWIEDAVGFSSFKYLPKEKDKLRFISVDFDDFEPVKLKLLLNLLGLNLEKGRNKYKVNSILGVTPFYVQEHGDEFFFLDYKVQSSDNEEYFVQCYFSKVDGLKSFDLTNHLKAVSTSLT